MAETHSDILIVAAWFVVVGWLESWLTIDVDFLGLPCGLVLFLFLFLF